MSKRRARGDRNSRESSSVMLRVAAPWWFRALYAVGTLPLLACVVVLIVWSSRRGFSTIQVLQPFVLAAVLGAGVYGVPIFLSSYIASEYGIERVRMLGARQRFAWSDIIAVRNSRLPLHLPRDVAYIVSRTGQTMAVMKSMPRYQELLRLIEARAPNLSTRPLAADIEPRVSSWTSLWITVAGVVILYLVARMLYAFWR